MGIDFESTNTCMQEAEEMVVKVISAAVTNPKLTEKSYREALANSEETLGVANAIRFKVDKLSTTYLL